MPLNLTFPGFSGGRKKPAKGRIINQTPSKSAEDEAAELFKENVNPNVANTALYRQHTATGGGRTQQRTMTGASNSVADFKRPSPGGTSGGDGGGGSDSWSWGRSKLGSISRALKKLTGG